LGAAGAALTSLPDRVAATGAVAAPTALRAAFAAYGLLGVSCALLYLGLRLGRAPLGTDPTRRPLGRSRGVVRRLAALFSLDSFGSGFAVQSMLVLWLARRFGLAPAQTGPIFAAMGILAAFSQLVAAPLARRIGIVRTMVYTHIPANL